MSDNINSFNQRLREIMLQRGETQSSLSVKTGIQRATLSQYIIGKTKPNTDVLAALCRELEVSSDWLLGLSDVQNPLADMKGICKSTGLSECAVGRIQMANRVSALVKDANYTLIGLLSSLLEDRRFFKVLAHSNRYISYKSSYFDTNFPASAEYIACRDLLKKHGFGITTPEDRACTVFRDKVSDGILEILDTIAEKLTPDHIRENKQKQMDELVTETCKIFRQNAKSTKL